MTSEQACQVWQRSRLSYSKQKNKLKYRGHQKGIRDIALACRTAQRNGWAARNCSNDVTCTRR